ncbi:MAG: hypothetical protein IT369_15435 [Candidatus Latescibacteria bacterium]|nr:hypothetical protein [Candidatus Latescibacterota bacterium]
MDKLVLPDLNQIPLGTDSFLGKALALGRQFDRLPESLGDALIAYLRAHALAFAQRYRTGIGIGRERLERGLKQAFICVDLELETRSAGDLNQAVDLLAGGELEPLRQRGWEEALVRLARMRTQARAWSPCREVLFLRESKTLLKEWCQLVPETWTSCDLQGEEIWLDPRQDYRRFQALEIQISFLRSLPAASLEGLLQAAPRGGAFADVLRQLVLALGLGLERLTATPGEVKQFHQACFRAGKMLPALKDQILGLFATHLEKALPYGLDKATLSQGLAAQIAVLEQTAPERLERLFIVSP